MSKIRRRRFESIAEQLVIVRGINGRGGLRISTHYSLGLFVWTSLNWNSNCDPRAIVSSAARTSLTMFLGPIDGVDELHFCFTAKRWEVRETGRDAGTSKLFPSLVGGDMIGETETMSRITD